MPLGEAIADPSLRTVMIKSCLSLWIVGYQQDFVANGLFDILEMHLFNWSKLIFNLFLQLLSEWFSHVGQVREEL